MLEITKNDIQELDDSELRTLIGRLCEAELYDLEKSISAVSYGGNQDAKDGGVDVRVSSSKFENGDFILSNETIFQVKKPSMPPLKIKKEMKDSENVIKECIFQLSEKNGAYIIVSSGDDLTDLTYKRRIEAMKEVLKEYNIENIKVEFYDCNKIATWVRKYPSLICLVNEILNRNTNGWTSYCNWSNRSEDEKPYIIDKESVIFVNNFSKDSKLEIVDGINQMRNALSEVRKSIRLVGLSGVGKTRLAQALFDESIGDHPLNKEMVIYGDVGNSLVPEPILFINQLIRLGKKVLIIVDNCDMKLHHKLTEICQYQDSKLSLMTIEYDVKESDSSEFINYYLGTTSKSVLTQLLKRDFSKISSFNIDTIARYSDGNFRVAIYLAKSIAKQNNIGVLNEDDLCNRLFYQGSEVDQKLMRVGEVCSLFYSFNFTYIDNSSDELNELNIISKLLSMEPHDVYIQINQIKSRLIIQQRGDMCAILPHALANKYAMNCLEKMPAEFILNNIQKNRRLFLSFFRRLKFLNSSQQAHEIAKKFFSSIKEDDLVKCSEDLFEKIKCISILNPELVLKKLRRISNKNFFSNKNKLRYEWARILQYIAYDEKMFERSVMLIIKFVLEEKENKSSPSIKKILYTLFHFKLSYTCASLQTRLNVVDFLIKSPDIDSNLLGIELINELLRYKVNNFFVPFDSGSQIRDYEIEFNQNIWYTELLDYCVELLDKNEFYEEIKEIIVYRFRELNVIGFIDKLEEIVLKNLKKAKWPRIWNSLNEVKCCDYDKLSPENKGKIDLLFKCTTPIDINSKIKVYLRKNSKFFLESHGFKVNRDLYNEKINSIIFDIGKEVARDDTNIKEYLMLLNNSCDVMRIRTFVEGLFKGYRNKEKIIYLLLNNVNEKNEFIYKEALSKMVEIFHTEDSALCESFLDRLLKDNQHNKYYSKLQMSYSLTNKDIIRMKKAKELDIIRENDLQNVEWIIYDLSSSEIIEVFNLLPNTSITQSIILVSLLNIYDKGLMDDELKSFIRNKLIHINYEECNVNDDYYISELTGISFSIEYGEKDAEKFFQILKMTIKEKYIYFNNYESILIPLIKLYPVSFLNVMVDYDEKNYFKYKSFFNRVEHLHDNVFNYIKDEIIIDWIKDNGKIEKISTLIKPYIYNEKIACFTWSDLGNYIIDNYYENEVVINNLVTQIYAQSYSDKYLEIIRKRLNLFSEMKRSVHPKIREIGEKNYNDLKSKMTHDTDDSSEIEFGFDTFE